jgi:hypothetical protein
MPRRVSLSMSCEEAEMLSDLLCLWRDRVTTLAPGLAPSLWLLPSTPAWVSARMPVTRIGVLASRLEGLVAAAKSSGCAGPYD